MQNISSQSPVRISSRYAFVLKRVFPSFWFGITGIVLVAALLNRQAAKAPMTWLVPLGMGVIGYWIVKKTLWALADEVVDCQDHLLVRRGSEECVVRICDVMNVSSATFMNPPTITLRLAVPGKFGDEISFSPARPFSFDPFARNAIAEDLMVRVDTARRERAH